MITKLLTRSACLIAVIATSSVATSAGAQVPHTFTSGTPAKAAEVNDNFTYLVQQLAAANATITQLSQRAVPVGAVMPFAGTTPPDGWLLCDGAAVSRTQYAALFAVLGVAHGNGDQIDTFNLPDYRGRFLRGVDGTAHRDPDVAARAAMGTGGNTGNAVGSVQGGQIASHNHGVTDPGHAHSLAMDTTGGWSGTTVQGSNRAVDGWGGTAASATGVSVNASGGAETRPINAYVNYIIKY